MAHNSNAERNAIVRQWVTTLHMHGSIIGCNDANNHSNDDDDADDDHQQQLFVCAARERANCDNQPFGRAIPQTYLEDNGYDGERESHYAKHLLHAIIII